MDEPAVEEAHKTYKAEIRKASGAKRKESAGAEGLDEQATEVVELDWKERLLDLLLRMTPDAFERLAQRLLREAGFVSANVTGRTGDGGIDGLGVYRLSLVSFRCSSSASATEARSEQVRYGTFEEQWRAEGTRGC